MFEPLKRKIKQVQGLSAKRLFKQLFQDKEFTNYIIELNTQYQLFQLGVNSEGEKLGDYSSYTKILKERKGQPTDRVTLKDTGEFYKSFKCKYLSNGNGEIQIVANTKKTDENGNVTDLLIDWGKEIIGLDETSLQALRKFAEIKIARLIENNLVYGSLQQKYAA